MKRVGLIGGMSWESSLEYYRLLNEGVRDRLGGLSSAKCLLDSVNFSEIEELQRIGDWKRAGEILLDSATRLESGGADFFLICTNTMHIVSDFVSAGVGIPLVHIADATALRIKSAGLKTVGLLGTRFTMEKDFYKGRLAQEFDINVVVPDVSDRTIVHDVIYDELCQGKVRQTSKKEYQRIIETLVEAGAEGVILGCTEIGLLVGEQDATVPVFDSTRIHVDRAVELCLLDSHWKENP